MSNRIYKSGVLALLLALAFVSPLSAITTETEEQSPGTNPTTTNTMTMETERTNFKEKAKKIAETKLSENRERVCEQKQARLQAKLDKIATQGTKQLEVFDKISQKVQAFKTAKNLTVTNYETLTGEVSTARTAAVEAVAAASKAPDVNCADPSSVKTGVETYKKAVEKRVKALKVYKTAVRNSLIAVKSSHRQNDSNKPAAGIESTSQTTTSNSGDEN